MKLQRYFQSALLGLVSTGFAVCAAAASLPYDEQADPSQSLASALASARDSNRRVLIVFGANWCEDCRALDSALHSDRTLPEINQHFVVMKVDVGHFDKNLEFAKLYGKPIAKGIPSVVVVTPKNEIVYETRAGELADARRMGPAAINAFFSDLGKRPAGY